MEGEKYGTTILQEYEENRKKENTSMTREATDGPMDTY